MSAQRVAWRHGCNAAAGCQGRQSSPGQRRPAREVGQDCRHGPDPTLFTAAVATSGPLEGDVSHVGWAENSDGRGLYLIFMRGQIEGHDPPCFVGGNDETYQTAYGRPERILIAPRSAEIQLSADLVSQLPAPETVRIAVPDGHPEGFVLTWLASSNPHRSKPLRSAPSSRDWRRQRRRHRVARVGARA